MGKLCCFFWGSGKHTDRGVKTRATRTAHCLSEANRIARALGRLMVLSFESLQSGEGAGAD